MFNPTEIIRKKRDGEKLTREELQFFIRGYLDGNIPEYQMSALLMAIYFQKMDFEETATLTDIMLHSGVVVDLSSIPGIKVDKHSTGGVGDKVSLILAPMVAACGVPVPMISGRGLGHTGGTLDKLESIPGFRVHLSLDEYKSVIRDIGLVMIGQTQEIAPADKRIYALRDVTGTVECIPLITASILSKKLAEGMDALVLDVKFGRGAFMQSEQDAIALAQTMIGVSKNVGKKTVALLTNMNQPLGYTIGNWLEVVECIECMQGKEVSDLMEVTYALGGAMLMLGKKATTIEEGIAQCEEALRSGKAFDKFKELVRKQHGDVSFINNPQKYPKSKYSIEVKSTTNGDIDNIDALEIGFSSIMLGAGRTKVEDAIDPKAGIVLKKKVGDSVTAGETLAVLYTDKSDTLETAAHRVDKAFSIATEPSTSQPLISAFIDEVGVHPWHR
jgi:pyrimidine-nucleoside phosphorylase